MIYYILAYGDIIEWYDNSDLNIVIGAGKKSGKSFIISEYDRLEKIITVIYEEYYE